MAGRYWTAALVSLFGALVLTLMAEGRPRAVTIALASGAIVETGLALFATASRRAAIARLALDPSAHRIPEVAAFAERLASAPVRHRLAGQLRRALAGEAYGLTPYIPARVRAHREQLANLAQALETPGCRIKPVAAVECHRLLSDAVNSPLYNPNLDPVDFSAALYRICDGMTYQGE